MCEPSEWSGGPSDTEGKTTRVGASECGQRTSFNRTREAGHLDAIQGVVASSTKFARNGASLLANSFGVGFIDWLDGFIDMQAHVLNAFGTAVSNDNIR